MPLQEHVVVKEGNIPDIDAILVGVCCRQIYLRPDEFGTLKYRSAVTLVYRVISQNTTPEPTMELKITRENTT
jgi:hypothetical protein